MSIFSVSTQKYSSVATEAKARKLQKEQSESAKFQNALANNEKTKRHCTKIYKDLSLQKILSKAFIV